MSTRIIASGGTGQHGVLAYLRLCVLCKDFFDFREPGDKFLPHLYILDKDKGGKGIPGVKTAAELLSDMATSLGCKPTFIDPTPLLRADDSRTNTFKDLFEGSELLELLFNQDQHEVKFRHGNFGHASVGSTVFFAKLRDTTVKDDIEVNNDTNYSSLEQQIKNTANQRIVHIGSSVGGTGSGVMPALLARLSGLKADNFHLAIPFLEWFNLVGRDEETRILAENRNKMMRQNRSSGLSFYLKNLQDAAAVLPLGYLNANREKYMRAWDDNYNQQAREVAVHLAAALAIWEFLFVETPISRGMYAFTPNDDFELPGQAKVGDYTLSSLFEANLTLIQEIKYACNYLRKPLDTRHVLLESNLKKVTVPTLRNLSKEEMNKLAEELEKKVDFKENCCNWLRSLDDIDNSLKLLKYTEEIPKGFTNLQELFPEQTNIIRGSKLSQFIYEHLVLKAKRKLKKITDIKLLTSANRLLPEYAVKGIKPPPKTQGQIADIDDPLHITQLYTSTDIHPQSIPSSLGITHYLNEVCFRKEITFDEDGKKWFDRYTLLLKGLASGVLEIEDVSLTKKRGMAYDLENIIQNLPESEDNSWKELKEFYRFKLRISNKEVILGATSPSTFIFPSMSAKEDWWNSLKERLSGAREVEATKLLTAWCNEIKRWDETPKIKRPFWFQKIEETFNEKFVMERSFSWLENVFPVFWGDKIIYLPFPKIEIAAIKPSWDKIAEKFGAKTYYFQENKLYSDINCKVIVSQDEEPALAEFIDLCKKVTSDKGVFEGHILEKETGGKIKSNLYTVIWLDIKEKDIGDVELSIEEGTISLIYKKTRIVLDPKKFHGVRPETIGTKEVIVFQETPYKVKYPDLPVKTKYIPLIEEEQEVNAPTTLGDTLEYSVRMKGRKDHLRVHVYSDRKQGETGEKGTILGWPNFKLDGWNVYYIYRDGESTFRDLNIKVLLYNPKDRNQTWDISPELPAGRSVAVTLAKEEVKEGDDALSKYSWKNEIPKYIVLSKGEKEVGLLMVRLEKVANFVRENKEDWGVDFGTSGSIIAFFNVTSKCLDIRSDYSNTILYSIPKEGEESQYTKEKIRENGKWFPTFPNNRPDKNTFVLSELTFCTEDFDLSRLKEYIPGEDFHLVSSKISPQLLKRNRVLGKLKWEYGRDEKVVRIARRGFFALFLLMASADRLKLSDPGPVGKIRPCIAYPLRMGKAGSERLVEDFKTACTWISNGTGLKFDEPKWVSESTAAASGATLEHEVIVADLGGATLDLWMGRRKEPTDYAADSILFGGFGLLSYFAEHLAQDIRNIVKDSIEDIKILEINLQRQILESTYEDVRDEFRKSVSPEFKRVQSGFFILITEYISRFAAGRILKRYPAEAKLTVQLATIGNGWKLNFSIDSVKNISKYVAGRVQDRLKELIPHKNVEIIPLERREKEDVAIGAARYTKPDVEEQADIKTFAGINCTSPPTLSWSSPIPFELGEHKEIGKKFIDISVISPTEDTRGVHPLTPPIPGYVIINKVYADFTGTIHKAGDHRIYDIINDKLNLLVSPFGLLLEILLKSLNDLE